MSDIREKGPLLSKIRELYQIILDRNEELITGPNGYSRAYLVEEDSTIEKFNTDVAVLHNTVGIYAAKMEEMLESFIELEVSELTSFITKLEDTVRTLKAEHLIKPENRILENNAVTAERGQLIENVDVVNDIIVSNTENNHWLLTEDGYLEFHGGGALQNRHGEIIQSYGSSTPVGSEGIETGLMKIFNYASQDDSSNGKFAENYEGPFDRDMIIEKILDAGLNYYFKEPEEPLDLNDRKYWQWDLKENLNNNAKRRVKLPDNIFKFYQQLEPGSKWYSYVGNDPVNFIDPTGLESVDAAYSRNKYLSNENPILFHNEQIIRLQNEKIGTSTKIDSSKNQINILYGEIDEARMGYCGKVLKRGWDIATFAYYKVNNSFDGMLDSLTNALSGEVYEDNPLMETVGIEIKNMKKIFDLKKYVGSKNEELERINSELESHLQQLAEYPKEKSSEECNN